MKSVRFVPNHLLELFAEHKVTIVELCRDDEEFRELCEHYEECRRVASELTTAIPANMPRIAEYDEMLNELESEVREVLKACVELRGRNALEQGEM